MKRMIVAILSISFVSFLFLIGFYLSNFGFSISKDHVRWSEFGDFIGGTIGTTFAFLSLCALLYTIHLQTQELMATREVLQESSAAHQQQAEAASEQVRLARLQASEERLASHRAIAFQMLERWSGPYMRERREKTWSFLASDASKTLGKKIDLALLKDLDSDSYYGLTEVALFCSDLNKMIHYGIVDPDITFVLFYNTLYPWFDYLKRIDVSRRLKGSSAGYNRSVAKWYKEWVFSLEIWFDRRIQAQNKD